MTVTLQDIQKLATKKKVPNVRTGQTVRIHQKIKEGEKERIQIYEGLIIKMNSGHGADKTMTVRKVVEGIGVEKIFPLYSPVIEKIEIKKESKVRRAKLYYMRTRSGKSARLKENLVSSVAEKEMEAAIEEAVEAKAAAEAAESEQSAESERSEDSSKTEEQPTEEAAQAQEEEAKSEEATSESPENAEDRKE